MTKTKSFIKIDLNCDLGEGTGNDEAIMPFISSANIACGYHAGDETTIKETIQLAVKHKVAVGAHPSFPDKENFGRTDMHLPLSEIYNIVTRQIKIIDKAARKAGTTLHHVKLHGALYNMAARTKNIAATVALAVKDYNEHLIIYGSRYSISEAKKIGVRTASEVYADRMYNEDGSLVSRKIPVAVIEEHEKAVKQVLQMIQQGSVDTIDNITIPVEAETICLHGDNARAVDLVKHISSALKKEKIKIQAF